MSSEETQIDVKSELSGLNVQDAHNTYSAFEWELQTPSNKFYQLLASLPNTELYVLVLARDYYNAGLANSLVDFTRAHASDININVSHSIIPDFQHAGSEFDCVLLLGPLATNVFKSRSTKLGSRTVQAVPIFRCEFTGDETPDQLTVARRNIVETLVWKREASPRVYMAFVNSITKSTSRKLKITSKETEAVGEYMFEVDK